MTYAAPLRVTLRLIVWDVDDETGSRSVRDIKEQDVYMGDLPLMTDIGTFVMNGTERVIVTRCIACPGVFFDDDKRQDPQLGQVPVLRPHDPLSGRARLRVRCQGPHLCPHDRRRKLPTTTLLLALGLNQEEILGDVYDALPLPRPAMAGSTLFRPDRCEARR